MLFHVHPRVSMVDEPESMGFHSQSGCWHVADAFCMSCSSYVMVPSPLDRALRSSFGLLIIPMGLCHVFHARRSLPNGDPMAPVELQHGVDAEGPESEPAADGGSPLHVGQGCHGLEGVWLHDPLLHLSCQGPSIACDLVGVHGDVLVQAAPLLNESYHTWLGYASHVADVVEAVEHLRVISEAAKS